ncbi:tRNA threonylcarbamoyladenosine biosynthesis protein TsaB [Cohaesibacter sp. ES.047]|uniref:tRNA (adenosine(37)-N6)-threonylcarbamoyltransferase complex dimerization subunit type 1 TsaB n=1 Tax=Cohaesibacter sp. ES.047 TaxID=1798205 RepID=UPI000BB79342|nr:tRNA (adenosine(37)-N6)-threonylcarbamoyltransferase complex dimerization subunit type 1 TsaB [Cohaesibacter sp. ES.047]SNY90382.1 tRNA threonylcarbamoyladenosine biosynthesis protein TsaB [Cohaesibacter sp. ES.047]
MNNERNICLALDTALDACSVGLAVWDGETRREASRSVVIGRGHAERLMDEIAALLEEEQLGYQDLTRLAVTVGPGSFTGLRVGLATARALALALDVPLIGASTLFALGLTARRRGHHGPLAALIDARRDQIYGEIFNLPEIAPTLESLEVAAARSAQDFASLCVAHRGLAMIGSGAALVRESAFGLENCEVFSPAHPDMAALAVWALDQSAPETAPSPLYLRAPDAKPQAASVIARLS